MSEGIQLGDGYTFQTLNGVSSLSIDKPYIPDNNPSALLGVVIPKFPDPPLPPDIPVPPVNPTFVDPFAVKPSPLQFQCNVLAVPVSGTATPVVQVAMGSVTYTHSLMPYIKAGPFVDHRQAYMNFVAVISAGVTPTSLAEPTSPWMLGGGGYALTGTGRWFVTLSKWDVGNGAFDSGLLNQNVPWVSFVKSGSPQFDALFVDAGPSLYQNTTNIQKMEGYEDVIEGPDETMLDWGHCHTTYFNPRFFGHHVRVLAVIDSIPAPPCEVSVVQVRAGSSTNNEIQQIIFTGIYRSGTVTFSYGGGTSSPFNPGNQSAFDLQQCLNAISALNGNVVVQQAGPGVFQVEFTNVLRNTDVATLSPSSSMTSFSTWYKVSQCHVGSQDIVIPCELNATFLMNKLGVTEAEDPYYINEATTPAWNNVVNNEDAIAANALGFIPAFSTPVINSPVPRTITTRILNYYEESGCTEEPMLHPFLVQLDSTAAGSSTYSIISGTVNNLVPNGVNTPITVSTSTYFVYIKLPFSTGVFPANNTDFKWDIAATMPADTDGFGYIKVANINADGSVSQFVTGSLWADRIKLGTLTARYFFSRI
jgi:hypothetical protein